MATSAPGRAGRLAIFLAAAAPLVAAASGIFTVLVAIPASGEWQVPGGALAWFLILATVACALAASGLLWRGARTGALAPLLLVTLAAAPWALGVALTPLEMWRAEALARQAGTTLAGWMVGPQDSRLLGALLAWGLLGSVAFGLVVASFSWRTRGGEVARMLQSLALGIPFAAYIAWAVATARIAPSWLELSLLGFAVVGLPVNLALLGAAMGAQPSAHPRRAWLFSAAIVYLLVFLAAASLVSAMAMADALSALGAIRQTWGQILAAMRQDMAAANRLGLTGALLLLVPVAGITLRLYGSRPAALRSAGAPLSVLVLGALLVAANALAARLPARRVLGHLARLEQLKPREAAPPPAEAQPPPEAAAVAAPSPAAPRMRVIDTVAPVEISPEGEGGASGGMEEGLAGGVEGGLVGGVIGAPMEVPGTVQVTPPERISGPQPGYTEAAREARIQGTVVLEAAIDEHGDVTDVRVLRGLPLGLDRAAADAVKKWKFKPALREGEPVAATKVIPVPFRISSP